MTSITQGCLNPGLSSAQSHIPAPRTPRPESVLGLVSHNPPPPSLMCLTPNTPHNHCTCGGVCVWWWAEEVAVRNQSRARHSSGPKGNAVNLSRSSWMGSLERSQVRTWTPSCPQLSHMHTWTHPPAPHTLTLCCRCYKDPRGCSGPAQAHSRVLCSQGHPAV